MAPVHYTNLYLTKCCGVKEISGLTFQPEEMMQDICRESTVLPGDAYARHRTLLIAPYPFVPKKFVKLSCGTVMFTDIVRSGKGKAFKVWLEKEGFGKVSTLPIFNNPNSHNDVEIFIWYPNIEKVLAWAAKNDIEHEAPKEQGPPLPRVDPGPAPVNGPYREGYVVGNVQGQVGGAVGGNNAF